MISCEFGECYNPFNDTSYKVPMPKVEAMPDGFIVSIPAERGMGTMEFFGNINKVLYPDPLKIIPGDIYGKVIRVVNKQFTFRYQSLKIPEEYVVYYWLLVARFEIYYRRINLRFKVLEENGVLVAFHY